MIPAVLVYVKDEQGRVLMLHREGRAGDYHDGKWNGLGGKLERDESPWEGVRRELREESGLDLPDSAFRLLGVLQFPNFKAHKNEDWMVYLFTASTTDTQPLERSDEGRLEWVSAKDLLSLNLWAGDREFVPHVLDDRPFMGTIWYRGQEVHRSDVRVLKPSKTP